MDNAMRNAQCSMPNDKRGGVIRAVLFALCIVHSALLASGCAKTQAASVPDGPPLAVPAAPPRVIAPPADEPLAENPPEPQPAATPPPTNASQPPRPRPRATTTGTTPAEEPKPAETPVPPPASTEAPVVRPVPATVDAAAERRIRDTMRKAQADLQRVDYQKLSANGKLQYEQAKGFIEQTERELKDRNYVFLTTIVDKATQIATELLAAR
jgi:outer membrane biosynthesis protein TonB